MFLPPPTPAEPLPENIPLKVLYEDEHILALMKPAGMVVQPMASARSGTVLHGVMHHMIATQQCAADDDAAAQALLQGVVHR